MNRLFAETYARDQEIEARYDAAEPKNDQAAMEQARTDHFALEADIQAQGKPFERLYSLYAAAMKVGNEYIDISELHEYAASTYIRKTGWFMNSMTDIQRKHIGKILQGEIAGRRK